MIAGKLPYIRLHTVYTYTVMANPSFSVDTFPLRSGLQ